MKALNLNQTQILWNIAALCCLLCACAFYYFPEVQVCRILPIEFSDRLEEFHQLVAQEKSIDTLKNHTYLDFFLIVCYSVLFYASFKIFILSIQLQIPPKYLLLCLLPGLFDVVENWALLGLLDQENVSDDSCCFSIFYWAVRIKWLLIIPFLLMTMAIASYHLIVFVGTQYNKLLTRNNKEQ